LREQLPPNLVHLAILLALLYVYVPVRENDNFQYDYVLRENDYFQYDYISVNDYFPKVVRCNDSPLHHLCTTTPNKVPQRVACLFQGITAHRLTPSTVPPLGTH
jgi:hypothetical protein